jgi:hypothetical protein
VIEAFHSVRGLQALAEDLTVLAKVVEKTRQASLLRGIEHGGVAGRARSDQVEVFAERLPIRPFRGAVSVVHAGRRYERPSCSSACSSMASPL